MKHPLYLIEQGSKVRRRGQRLVVTKDDKTLAHVTTLQVSQVLLFGAIEITTPALQLLLAEGIEVVFLNRRGQLYGRLVGKMGGNSPLRVAQVLAAQEKALALLLARRFVHGKVHNMRVFLQRYARRRPAAALDSAVVQIGQMMGRIEAARDVAELMGIEGQATAAYFKAWPALLKAPWTFERRVRRPPTDPVNALLGFAYTLLYQNVIGALQASGLDPYVGFLHQVEYNRPSLALDLVEEFRPIVADSVVLRCLNNEIITEAHMRQGETRPIELTADGVRLFVREFETRMTQRFKHPVSGERVNYRRVFLLQAYALGRAIRSSGATYQPFLVR